MTNLSPCVTQKLGPLMLLAVASLLLNLYRAFVFVPLNKSDVSSTPVIQKLWSADPGGGRGARQKDKS